jgi:hypothetical protein
MAYQVVEARLIFGADSSVSRKCIAKKLSAYGGYAMTSEGP